MIAHSFHFNYQYTSVATTIVTAAANMTPVIAVAALLVFSTASTTATIATALALSGATVVPVLDAVGHCAAQASMPRVCRHWR